MKRLWVLLCCLFCLTGCSHTYLERQVYPLVLSIDLKDGQYQVGMQAPKSGPEGYDTLVAMGDTPMEAIAVLEASTPYPLHFSQVRQCLIGYDLAATTELRPLLRTLFNLPAMRPNCQVMVAQGSAVEVMQAQKPDFGQRLSTHLNLLFERLQRENTLPDSALSYCVRELGDHRSDLLLGLCAINPQVQPKDQPAFSQDGLLPPNQIAGLLSRTGPNSVEYMGSAAVCDGRVGGMLTARETQLCLSLLELADLRTAVEGEQVQLQILLPERSALDGMEEEVGALLQKLQTLRCDALRFGSEASKAFRTTQSWEQFRFRQKYPAAGAVILTR